MLRCSHTPCRQQLAVLALLSSLLLNVITHYWRDDTLCPETSCSCNDPTIIPPLSNMSHAEGGLANIPANLIPIERIKNKHFRHNKTPQVIKGLGHLDQVSLSRFYACSPAKMMILQSVGSNEKTCYKQRHFQSGSSPMVALVSFQGSGNTWVRHFLEQATGVYTGSIYCDPGLKITYPGEYVVSGNVLVVKTHHADTTKLPPDIQQALSKQEYDKAIILVRNPYNALLSEGNRRWAGMMQPSLDQHVGVASEQAFIGNPKWDWYVEYKGMAWIVLLHTWLSKASSIKTLVVQYENIQTNFTHELKRMLEFLDMPVTEERLKCVEQNKEGLFKRKVHLNFDPFSPENKQAVNRIIDQAAPLLAKHNIHYDHR